MQTTPRMAALLGMALLLTALAVPAGAQTRPETPVSPDTPAQGDARDCVPGRTAGPPCDTLTEKLNPTDGVIRPPTGVDPEIQTGAPDPTPNSTPVIRPGDLQEQPPQTPSK